MQHHATPKPFEPTFRAIHPQGNRSMVLKYEPFGLKTYWHYHPEVEFIFFEDGICDGVIGNGFQEFRPGDVVLLGANLPHVLQENVSFKTLNPNDLPAGLIVQFVEEFLGEAFFKKTEFAAIGNLLIRAKRGLRFRIESLPDIHADLYNMPNLSDLMRVLTFLKVLNELALCADYEYLTPAGYHFDHSADEDRMRRVNEFVYHNFAEPIRIAEVAAVANMSETAFCRYFKARTLKTFTNWLNEIRIAYACKELLNSPEKSISDVCFEAGFTGLSYFNRQFQRVMKLSPSSFRQKKR